MDNSNNSTNFLPQYVGARLAFSPTSGIILLIEYFGPREIHGQRTPINGARWPFCVLGPPSKNGGVKMSAAITSFYLHDEVRAKLSELAQKTAQSRSAIVNDLIRQARVDDVTIIKRGVVLPRMVDNES